MHSIPIDTIARWALICISLASTLVLLWLTARPRVLGARPTVRKTARKRRRHPSGYPTVPASEQTGENLRSLVEPRLDPRPRETPYSA